MGINKNHLLKEIIRPTLKSLDMWSTAAENLLLGTCAQETHLGTYLHQLGEGPGLGIYSMEPNTHQDLWNNFIHYRKDIKRILLRYCGYVVPRGPQALVYNLRYATAMARLHYWRVPEALPDPFDITELAKYWKKYYNTNLGKGTFIEFRDNYHRLVTPG